MALLIGNKNYRNPKINNLVSPENDIRELHKLLEAPPLNFKVISLVNLEYREMMDALEKFCEMLAVPHVYALFYYSGYGFRSWGDDYLVPVDATLPLHCNNGFHTDIIKHRMERTLSQAVVVIDCCTVEFK